MLFGHERSSGVGASTKFMEVVQQRGLLEMGFTGPRFMWNHGNYVIQRRLD